MDKSLGFRVYCLSMITMYASIYYFNYPLSYFLNVLVTIFGSVLSFSLMYSASNNTDFSEFVRWKQIMKKVH